MKKSLRIASVALALVMITSVMLSGTFAKYTSEFAGEDTALVARWSFAGTPGMIQGNTPSPKTLDIFSHAYDQYITQKGTDSDGTTSYIIAPGVDGQFDIEFNYSGDVDAAVTLNLSSEYTQNVPLQFSLDPNFATFTYNLNELSEEILQNLFYANGAVKPGTPPDPTAVDSDPWAKIDDTEVITAHTAATNSVFKGSAAINPALVSAGLAVSPKNTVVVTKTDTKTNVTYVSIPVYWRWPYDVSDHDNAALFANGFIGSGAGGAWTDADDTNLGKASNTANRLEYRIKANLTATQVVPEK